MCQEGLGMECCQAWPGGGKQVWEGVVGKAGDWPLGCRASGEPPRFLNLGQPWTPHLEVGMVIMATQQRLVGCSLTLSH